jgi:hypothetical protein
VKRQWEGRIRGLGARGGRYEESLAVSDCNVQSQNYSY